MPPPLTCGVRSLIYDIELTRHLNLNRPPIII
jgi:hypothetical protein